MKKLLATSACLLLSCFVGGAMAAKPAKSTILHCGCTVTMDGAAMVYEAISVSNKSRGHNAHAVEDSCFDGTDGDGNDIYVDFVRAGADCQLDDGPALGDLELCEDQMAGEPCGMEVK